MPIFSALQKKNSREWEHTRLIAYLVEATAFGRKGKMPKIEKWMPLNTDKLQPDDGLSEKRRKIFTSLIEQSKK